jgi:hypothetical protein
VNAPIQQAQFDPLSLFNIEIEQELLGAILNLGGFVLDTVDSIIASTDFYEPVHQTLFARFSDAHARGRGINLSLAIGALGSDANIPLANGVTVGQYIARVAASATVMSKAADYAKLIVDFAQRRKIVAVLDLIQGGIAANHGPAEIAGVGIDALDDIASANVARRLAAWILAKPPKSQSSGCRSRFKTPANSPVSQRDYLISMTRLGVYSGAN